MACSSRFRKHCNPFPTDSRTARLIASGTEAPTTDLTRGNSRPRLLLASLSLSPLKKSRFKIQVTLMLWTVRVREEQSLGLSDITELLDQSTEERDLTFP